jgi:thioester reductase-like protein
MPAPRAAALRVDLLRLRTTTGVFHEDDLDVGQSFKNFYEETKFLAEMEVARSGLPVTTYRPSIVVGDSRTGETGSSTAPTSR